MQYSLIKITVLRKAVIYKASSIINTSTSFSYKKGISDISQIKDNLR